MRFHHAGRQGESTWRARRSALGAVTAVLALSSCGEPAGSGVSVVFSSNRSGTYDLYLQRPEPGDPMRLTVGAGALHPAVSPDGSLIAFTRTAGPRPTLGLLRLEDGSDTQLAADLIAVAQPRFSPDGSTVVFEGRRAEDERADIFVLPAAGGELLRLTTDEASDGGPCFSTDGSSIFFVSARSGTYEVWQMDADGQNQRPVTRGMSVFGRPAPAPDGRALAFSRQKGGRSDRGELVRFELASEAVEVLGVDDDSEPAFSPDGARLAFTTLRYANPEVATMALGRPGAEVERVTADPQIDGSPAFISSQR